MKRIISLFLMLLMVLGTMIYAVAAETVSPYRDVKPGRWSYSDIMYVTDNGLMNGKAEGIFAPAETMTRAMVVTVLYRLEGSPELRFQPAFTDVKDGTWYSAAVNWASINKIVEGMGDGKYEPMADVTREQLATVIMRYAEYKLIIPEERADITVYADYGRVHDYAKDALSWANAVGLITGVTETTLEPRSGATREQFAAILRRFTEGEYKYQLRYNRPAGYSTYTEKEYPLVTDADIYVAVDGNDSNPGTLEQPIATFGKAVAMVRDLKNTATDEIKVAFKAGNYGRLNVSLTEADSGTAAAPITYCAYGDGDVIFQNGITVTEDMFVPLDESDKAFFVDKYEADIKKVELAGLLAPGDDISVNSQLVNNGQRMNQARYPNKTTMGYVENMIADPVDHIGEDKKIKLTSPIMAIRMKNYHTFEGTELIGFLAHPYMCNVVGINSYDASRQIITFKEKPYQGTNNYTNQPCFFSNISEELDCMYEYWVDVAGKALYVYAPDTDYVLTTRGTYINNKADYVSFVGFDFCGSSDGFFNINADHVTVKLCDMHVGAGKFAVMAKGKYITVSECEISYLAGGGIFLESSLSDVDNVVSGGCIIDNNSIHDFELKYKVYLPAVRLYNTVGVRVSHNEFYNSTHSAIIYGHAAEGNVYIDKKGGRGIDNVIEYNVFHHCVDNSGDCGAIYSDRSIVNRDNIIRYNIFYDMGTKSGAQMAIYLGDSASGQQVYGNVFYNAGTEAVRSDGRDNIIRDNVFIQTGEHMRPLFYNAKYRSMYLGDGKASVNNLKDSPTWGTFYDSFSLIPKSGSAARAVWESRWPKLLQTKTDMKRASQLVNDPDFIINPSYCVLENNYAFGITDHYIHADVPKFSTVKNNPLFSLAENPLFVNPTLGDYSIREDADFFKIPYKEIGRY